MSPPATSKRVLTRLEECRDVTADGCWLWTGARSNQGYGVLRLDGRTTHAHTAAYLLYVGPVPDGLEIDHLCRNRACFNPAHLEAVTHAENMLRGDGPTARNAALTHCPYGHPYSAANTYVAKRGARTSRDCRICRSRRGRAYRARQASLGLYAVGLGAVFMALNRREAR